MNRNNYMYTLLEGVDKKSKPEYVKIRAARAADNPPLIVSIPRPIANQLKIEVGDTFAMVVEGDNKIVMIKATI